MRMSTQPILFFMLMLPRYNVDFHLPQHIAYAHSAHAKASREASIGDVTLQSFEGGLQAKSIMYNASAYAYDRSLIDKLHWKKQKRH